MSQAATPSAPAMAAPAVRPARWRALAHSMRWRLVALFLLLALAVGSVFVFGSQRLLQSGWQVWARPMVSDYVDRLAAEVGDPPDEARARALVARLPVTLRIEGPRLNFGPPAPGWAGHAQRPGRSPWRDPARELHDDEGNFSLTRRTADGHTLRFGLRAMPDADRPRRIGLFTLAALLALTGLAYAVVHRLLAPLRPIGQGVARFGQGRFDSPIPPQRAGELGDLAQRINTMAGALQGMLEAKRALLLAISHELRSPLTRARLNAELVDDSPQRQALVQDLAAMRDLIDSLLEGERLAAGHSALQLEAVDLATLAQDLLHELAPALTRQPVLDIASDLPASVRADPTRLKLLLRNLVHNAVQHGGQAGSAPQLFARREADGRIALGVRDFGPGVDEDQLARLTEAFYRPDSARSRAAGGVGLGLYLCRLVAQAHGGELRCRRVQPGLEVAMVWPA